MSLSRTLNIIFGQGERIFRKFINNPCIQGLYIRCRQSDLCGYGRKLNFHKNYILLLYVQNQKGAKVLLTT